MQPSMDNCQRFFFFAFDPEQIPLRALLDQFCGPNQRKLLKKVPVARSALLDTVTFYICRRYWPLFRNHHNRSFGYVHRYLLATPFLWKILTLFFYQGNLPDGTRGRACIRLPDPSLLTRQAPHLFSIFDILLDSPTGFYVYIGPINHVYPPSNLFPSIRDRSVSIPHASFGLNFSQFRIILLFYSLTLASSFCFTFSPLALLPFLYLLPQITLPVTSLRPIGPYCIYCIRFISNQSFIFHDKGPGVYFFGFLRRRKIVVIGSISRQTIRALWDLPYPEKILKLVFAIFLLFFVTSVQIS